jgi:hypothetical protein
MMSEYTQKVTVTAHERLQVIGLLVLAERHNKALRDIEAAVMSITGETEQGGHSTDAVYSDYDADDLFGRLGITVEAPLAADAVDPHATK